MQCCIVSVKTYLPNLHVFLLILVTLMVKSDCEYIQCDFPPLFMVSCNLTYAFFKKKKKKWFSVDSMLGIWVLN